MPITIYPGSMKKRNANGSYSDLVPAIATDPEVLDDFAEEYSTSETYNIGDYCIHNSDFYKCNTNNTTGTWNINAWDRVTVGDELVDHKNTLTQLKADTFGSINLTGTNTTGSPITKRTFFYNNGLLTRATALIQPGSDINIGVNAETVTAGGLNALVNSVIANGGITQVRGVFATSASPSTDINRVTYFINNLLVTDDKNTQFNVIINQTGRHMFAGFIYPDKDYGGGILIRNDGIAYLWYRTNGSDFLKAITVT